MTASSETLLGLPMAVPPTYFPVDEEVTLPNSTYSMAKHLEEQIAVTFCRWDPALSITAMRFSNVMVESDYAGFEAWQDDPSVRRWNAWGYIDARDAAEAIRLALEVRGPGFERYVIANADTVMRTPSADLAAAEFPGVPFTNDGRGHRHAALDREGAARARVDAQPLLARHPGLSPTVCRPPDATDTVEDPMAAKKDDMPSTLQRSDEHAQEIYGDTLKSAEEQYGDGERAHRTAFAAVKHSYEKVGDHWEAKDEKGPSDDAAERSGSAPRPDQGRRRRERHRRSTSSRSRGGSTCPAARRWTRPSWSTAIEKANDRATRKARED